MVCTNGKRDACCAREGLPVYRALQKLVGSRTWQCTHVGGHRFAANILVLPEGLGYGRLAPADMPMLTAATAQNEILLEHFRGRSCYEPVVQAAEIHLYRRTSATQSGLFRFLQASLVDEDRWQVQFTGLEEGAVYQLTVQINRSTEQAFQSCKGDKQAPSLAFELADYRILPGLPGASGE